MKTTAQIFLSYAREDEEKVKNLYQQLSDAGFKPWMDKKDILPGEDWESCIQKAIRRSDFFLACLSAHSLTKRGFLQKEIKGALDIWQEMLDSDIYLIPVRLEDCEVSESLRKFQWVNLFEEDGWTRLVKAIQIGIERRDKTTEPTRKKPLPSKPHPTRKEPPSIEIFLQIVPALALGGLASIVGNTVMDTTGILIAGLAVVILAVLMLTEPSLKNVKLFAISLIVGYVMTTGFILVNEPTSPLKETPIPIRISKREIIGFAG